MLFGLLGSSQPSYPKLSNSSGSGGQEALTRAPPRREKSVETKTYEGEVGTYKAKVMELPQPIVCSKNSLAGPKSKDNRTNQGCRVYVGKELIRGDYLAVKEIVLKHSKKQSDERARYAKEVYPILQPNIRSEYDYLFGINSACGPRGFYVNSKKTRLYLLQNLMSGSCKEILDAITPKYATLPRRANVLMMCVLIARHAAEIHQRSLIHFDIKPNNIMFSKQQDRVEIIDFGLALLGPEEQQRFGSRG